MSDANSFLGLFALLIRAAMGAAGAAIAKRKDRSAVAWFVVCFIFSWMGVIVIALMPRSGRRQEAVVSTPTHDTDKWAALVASDADLAAGVERLKPYGERYVTELASTLLACDGKQDLGAIVDALLAKAKVDAETAADGAGLDLIGRHVDSIFRTARGLVAQLKGSRALAQVGQDFRLFDDLTDYREFYADRDAWFEITSPEERRSFFAAAREPLEQVNAGLNEAPKRAVARRSRVPVRVNALWNGFGARARDQAAAGHRQDTGDDLKLIAGIDAMRARQLNARGVTLYAQIAAWTPIDVEQISAALGLKGQIQEQNWVGQAKLLMSRYERCSECGHVFDSLASPHCPRHPPPGYHPAPAPVA